MEQSTRTVFPSRTVAFTLSSTPSQQQTPSQTATPAIARTLSKNCLDSYLLGVVGSKADPERGGVFVLGEPSDTPFTATFDIRNIGTCPWDPAFRFAYKSGGHLGGPDYVLIGVSIIPNDHMFINVGPLISGSHGYQYSYWILQSSEGEEFGPPLILRVHIN